MNRKRPGRFLYPFTRTFDGKYCARATSDYIYDLLNEKWAHHEFLIPSYIFSITSGIEGEINDAFIGFFIAKCGDRHKAFAKPYLRAPFNIKIRQAVLLLSSYRYELDESYDDVKLLDRLFQLRNMIVHITHHAQPLEIFVDEQGGEFTYDHKHNNYYARDGVDALTMSDIRKYHKLYDTFIRDFTSLETRLSRSNKVRARTARWLKSISAVKYKIKVKE